MVGGVGWARLWRKYLVGSRGVAKLRGPVPAVKACNSILKVLLKSKESQNICLIQLSLFILSHSASLFYAVAKVKKRHDKSQLPTMTPQ